MDTNVSVAIYDSVGGVVCSLSHPLKHDLNKASIKAVKLYAVSQYKASLEARLLRQRFFRESKKLRFIFGSIDKYLKERTH